MKPYGRWLLLGLGIIWCVTAYDIFCLQWLVDEQNPMAGWIIHHCGLWPFISFKIIGTAIATEMLRNLHWAYLAIVSVSYLALAIYLSI